MASAVSAAPHRQGTWLVHSFGNSLPVRFFVCLLKSCLYVVQLGLAVSAAVGVVALYKQSQGQSLDSAARDIKYGTKNAISNAGNQADRAANNVKRNF